MSSAVVLNELSYALWSPNEYQARDAIKTLSFALNEIKKINRSAFLLSRERLTDLVFASGVPLRKFLGDPALKENILSIFAFANRSPFSITACDIDGCECKCRGESAAGFLYCILLPGVALSFRSEDLWESDWIEVDVDELVEDDESVVRSSIKRVPNLAIPEAVANHSLELAPDLLNWRDGDHLLASMSASFPKLDLLPQVQDQVRGLQGGTEHLRQVAGRLAELNAAAEDWDVRTQAFPSWRSYITAEAETRKRLVRFMDGAGVERCYDLHARFTPGAGRIHFRLVPESGRIEIAYVGMKIE